MQVSEGTQATVWSISFIKVKVAFTAASRCKSTMATFMLSTWSLFCPGLFVCIMTTKITILAARLPSTKSRASVPVFTSSTRYTYPILITRQTTFGLVGSAIKMPSKKTLERRRAAKAAAEEVTISIGLKPYNAVYQVFLSQLALIPYFTVIYWILSLNNA
jgi:hypothetical protein